MRFSKLGFLLIALVFLLWTGSCAASQAGKPISNEPTAAPINPAPTSDQSSLVPTEIEALPTNSSLQPTGPPEMPTAILEQTTAEPEKTAVPPEILENRRLTLEWPATIRAGDGDVVRLTLEVDAAGKLVPTAEISGHKTSAQTVQIPNLFDTHHVLAEARLDLAGVQVEPNDLVSQTLLPGQRVDFSWSVRPEEVGVYRGTVWFYLRFIPINGGYESQRTISAQPIEIRSVDLIGLTGVPARIVGVLGTLVGSVLGLDNVISWLWKLLRNKKGG